MKINLFKSLFALSLIFTLSTSSFAQDFEGLLEVMDETLELTNEQKPKVNQLLTKYAVKLNTVLEANENAAEPNVEKMITDVRDIRDAYRKDLKKELSKDQYETYLSTIDNTMTEMFTDLAEMRLLDMKPMFNLTNEQISALKPVYGKNMLTMVRILFENAGTRLSIPKKVKIANQVKKIQSSTREALETTLNPEQLIAYDKWKEEQQKSAEENK